MKKNWFKILIIMVLCLISCLCVACSKKPNEDSLKPPVIEDNVITESATYKIKYDKELYLKDAINSYDFADGVVIYDLTGSTFTPIIDSTSVKFGIKGEYTVKYAYADLAVTQKVFIYSAPTMECETTKNTIFYDEIQSKLTQGITAKDSFGNDLEVIMQETSGMYKNGILQYGTYSAIFMAIDRAGNSVSATREIEVKKRENSPQLEKTVSIDVTDNEKLIEFNTFNEAVSLFAINGKAIEYKNADNGVIVLVKDILNIVDGNSAEIVVATNFGYDSAILNILDEKDPQINYFGMNNWIYELNSKGQLPIINKVNSRQNFEIRAKLFKGAEEIQITNNEFTPLSVGKYTYKIVPVKNNIPIDRLEKNLNINVYDKAEYNNIYASCDSLQFSDLITLSADSDKMKSSGINIDYGYSEDLNVGAYKYRSDASGSWQGYILANGVDAKKHDKISFDLWYDDSPSPLDPTAKFPYMFVVVGGYKMMITGIGDWIGDTQSTTYGNQWCNEKWKDKLSVRQIDDDGTLANFINPSIDTSFGKGMWLRVEASLTDILTGTDSKVLLCTENLGKFYVKNIKFLTGKVDPPIASDVDIKLYNKYKSAWPDDKSHYEKGSNVYPDSKYGYSNDANIGPAFMFNFTTDGNQYFVIAKDIPTTAKKIVFDYYYTASNYASLNVVGADFDKSYNINNNGGNYSNLLAEMSVSIINDNGTLGEKVNADMSDGAPAKNKWLHIELLLPSQKIDRINMKFDNGQLAYMRNVQFSDSSSLAGKELEQLYKATYPDDKSYFEISGSVNPNSKYGYSNDANIGPAFMFNFTTDGGQHFAIAKDIPTTAKKIVFDYYYTASNYASINFVGASFDKYYNINNNGGERSIYSNLVPEMSVSIINANGTLGENVNADMTDDAPAKNKWLHIELLLPSQKIDKVSIKFDNGQLAYMRNIRLSSDGNLSKTKN